MKNDIHDHGTTAVRERPEARVEHGRSTNENQEMQKKMEAAGSPGPAHKALDGLVGTWKAEVKCWMQPDGSPDVTQGTAKVSWILKGRFLEEEFQGEMRGKPFTGRTLIGYDNVKQKFNSVWVSDMQTSMFISE